MSAVQIIRRLLEEQDNDPLEIGDLGPYLGPVEFNASIKDIIDHARFLKQQAQDAGALNTLMHTNSSGKPPLPSDIDKAFLILAIEHSGLKMPEIYARRLQREMHSIWS